MDECFVSVDPLDVEAVLGVDPFLKDAESRGRAILSAMKADFSVLFSSSSFWGLINDLRHPDSLMYKKEEEVDFEASDRFVELLTAFWEIRYGRLLKRLMKNGWDPARC
ncbi:MAG: hypothetical protein UW70_C0086G0004 [Candidatus Peregrinibacteria bacterium GW2011_GWA2_44_7]|nr:MAG: hypothetical protein UW70_C0086G0004 [Candidatus Peregrinibacteria bacterium GW2011_GWA2_44_7]